MRGIRPIHDRSVLGRLNPDRLTLPPQYLALCGEEWTWTEDKAQAYVYGSHREAQDAADAHLYEAKWDNSEKHRPWALVLGNADAEAERQQRWLERDLSIEASGRTIEPSRVYAETARRLGEKADV